MKTTFVFRILSIFYMLLMVELTHAATFDFQINKGEVTSTSSFCPPNECTTQTGLIKGTFTADIDGENILLSNIDVVSELEYFSLPENPNSASNGTVFTATFSFSEDTLVLEGKIDSRAFDGPLQSYTIVASLTEIAEPEFDPLGYYTIRQDFRKCVSPMCGGIYLSKVNNRRMHCPDGTRSRECYVGTTNWEAIDGNPFSVTSNPLVKGKISKDKSLGSEWGIFTAQAAFRPASSVNTNRRVYGLKNNGIVCITSPCFSFDEYVINRSKVRQVSGIDLSGVKANKEDLDMAYQLMADGQTLIAAGYNHQNKRRFNRGTDFIATQFYLPISAKVTIDTCELGYEMTDFGCATKYRCFYPQLELTTIGGAAYIDPKTGETTSNITYSCVDTCEAPAEPVEYGRCVLALP